MLAHHAHSRGNREGMGGRAHARGSYAQRASAHPERADPHLCNGTVTVTFPFWTHLVTLYATSRFSRRTNASTRCWHPSPVPPRPPYPCTTSQTLESSLRTQTSPGLGYSPLQFGSSPNLRDVKLFGPRTLLWPSFLAVTIDSRSLRFAFAFHSGCTRLSTLHRPAHFHGFDTTRIRNMSRTYRITYVQAQLLFSSRPYLTSSSTTCKYFDILEELRST